MGGLAPGKLKSRRGWPSSPRRLIHGCYFFDPGFKNSLREKLYQLCGNGDTLIAIDSRRPGLFWSAKVALSFAATGICFHCRAKISPGRMPENRAKRTINC